MRIIRSFSKSLLILLALVLFSTTAYADNYYDYSTVYSVQSALNIAGYSCGAPDGEIGTNTRAAIVTYREDHHLGDNTEIDDILLYALGLSDTPVWYSIFNHDDQVAMDDVMLFEGGFFDAYQNGLKSIGASFNGYLGLGNYIQLDEDSYSVSMMFNADENEKMLATIRYEDGKYSLESIRSYLSGDYFYNASGDTVPYSKTGYSQAELDSRSVQALPEPTPAPAQAGSDYVLNTNTQKFHYPWCSSAGDIKPKNRWDYNGTREEIIGMGYQPCKRCNP